MDDGTAIEPRAGVVPAITAPAATASFYDRQAVEAQAWQVQAVSSPSPAASCCDAPVIEVWVVEGSEVEIEARPEEGSAFQARAGQFQVPAVYFEPQAGEGQVTGLKKWAGEGPAAEVDAQAVEGLDLEAQSEQVPVQGVERQVGSAQIRFLFQVFQTTSDFSRWSTRPVPSCDILRVY